jgi:hypothetical protein
MDFEELIDLYTAKLNRDLKARFHQGNASYQDKWRSKSPEQLMVDAYEEHLDGIVYHLMELAQRTREAEADHGPSADRPSSAPQRVRPRH